MNNPMNRAGDLLNQTRIRRTARPADPKPVNCVPWAYMTYQQAKDAGLITQIVAHMATLPPGRRDDYALYLHNHFGYPQQVSKW